MLSLLECMLGDWTPKVSSIETEVSTEELKSNILAAIEDSDHIHDANLAKLGNVALHPDLNESFTKL